MLNFKALLFDLDGTLLDTAPDFINVVNMQLSRHGRQPIDDDKIRYTVTDGSVGLIQRAFDIDPDEPQFARLREEFLDLYFANIANHTALFDGLQEVLNNCVKHQIPWGIATNKPWKYTEVLLNQLGLLDQSATTICPDHVAHPKPDPESLFLACSELSVRPQECIFVGDHLRDIQAGRNAGMRTIAAGWGYIEDSQNTNDWQADWVVDKSTELNSLLFT